MTDSADRWTVVAEAMRAQMEHLAMSQAELIRRSGVSEATIRPLLNGSAGNYRPATLAKVSVALGWEPGTIAAVVRGEEPPPTIGPRRYRITPDEFLRALRHALEHASDDQLDYWRDHLRMALTMLESTRARLGDDQDDSVIEIGFTTDDLPLLGEIIDELRRSSEQH